jgi:hypothetical protein
MRKLASGPIEQRAGYDDSSGVGRPRLPNLDFHFAVLDGTECTPQNPALQRHRKGCVKAL